MVVPAVTRNRWKNIEALTANYQNVYGTSGLHPVFCNEHQKSDLDLLEQRLATMRDIAIGECGLDGHTAESDMADQQFYFNAQLELAKRFQLPVIIHARGAIEKVILTLKDQKLSNASGNGVVHSYNGSLQQAHTLIDLGFTLSFGGPVTYDRSHKLHKLVQQLPVESMMLETDAPDQPPMGHRGQRNEPGHITTVLAAIATLRKQDPALIADHSNKNAKRLFALPESL